MNFQVKLPSPREPRSLTIGFAAVKGTAIEIDATVPEAGALAYDNFVGFLERNVTAAGSVITDFFLPGPGNLEVDAKVGCAVTCIETLEHEAGGTDLLCSSGDGAITSATAVGTLISFRVGKHYVTQSGENAVYQLVAQLTPEDDDDSVRCLFRRL